MQLNSKRNCTNITHKKVSVQVMLTTAQPVDVVLEKTAPTEPLVLHHVS